MISVVVPNFNGGEQLAKNLPRLLALLKKSGLDYEVIVSDDASTDDSIALLSGFHPVRLVTSSVNTGFAGNVDRGIREAKGEVIFTIKTDSVPKSADYFQLMLEHFDNKRVFSVSAALETIEQGKKEIRGQGVLIFFRGLFLHFRTYDDYCRWFGTMRTTRWLQQVGLLPKRLPPPDPRYSAWSDGSASAFRRDLYLKIGGFDKLYNPFYWEDTDLGYRAWKAGYQIDFEPKASLLHDFESGVIGKHYTKEQIRLISLRNQFVFVWKNSDIHHLILHCLWLPYHVVVALKNQNWQFFAAFWQAFWKCPQILEARWRQKFQ
ncbi:MAG: glycosyltransferase family 2 protein [Patescibacteria group bacterium]|nr:glycosyltransferase family 2 protein [Patescibacteria group bacterium]